MNKQETKILGVQKVVYTGITKSNPLMNVGRFFSLGDKVGMIKEGNSVILSKTRKGEKVNTVLKTGTSLRLSLYGISEKMDYFTVFSLNQNEVLLTPSSSEEIIRFSHKARRSEKDEALVVIHPGCFALYIKKPFLDIFSGPVGWSFYKTEDNLMWFECSTEPLPTKDAVCSGLIRDNHLYIPLELQKLIPLDKDQRYHVQFVNGKLIIELPDAKCSVCKTPIRRKTDKSMVYQVAESTAEVAENICQEIPDERESFFSEALKLSKEINRLLGGNK